MSCSWPTDLEGFIDREHEQTVEHWIEATRTLRALRAELGLAAMKAVPAAYVEGDLKGGEHVVRSQGWVDELKLGQPEEKHISATGASLDIHLPTKGLVDEQAEIERLEKQLAKIEDDLLKVCKKLSNQNFVERAKPEVVQKERDAQAELENTKEKLQARIKMFGD